MKTQDETLGRCIDTLMKEWLLKVTHQKDYEDRGDELISLGNDIRDKLENNGNIFMRYEELSSMNENIFLKESFKEGFISAIKLLRDIDCIRN